MFVHTILRVSPLAQRKLQNACNLPLLPSRDLLVVTPPQSMHHIKHSHIVGKVTPVSSVQANKESRTVHHAWESQQILGGK